MKRINHSKVARDKLLHIETEGGIINIQVGLKDAAGRPVTTVRISPDQGWILDAGRLIWVDPTAIRLLGQP